MVGRGCHRAGWPRGTVGDVAVRARHAGAAAAATVLAVPGTVGVAFAHPSGYLDSARRSLSFLFSHDETPTLIGADLKIRDGPSFGCTLVWRVHRAKILGARSQDRDAPGS
jgi:hypothetical protein